MLNINKNNNIYIQLVEREYGWWQSHVGTHT